MLTKRYSNENPPLSTEEALQAKEELISFKRETEMEMSMKKPVGRAPNEEWEDYQKWRKKALGFKMIVERQINFLKKWLEGQPKQESFGYHYYEKVKRLTTELSLIFRQKSFSNNESVKEFFECLAAISTEITNSGIASKQDVRELLCRGYQVFYTCEQAEFELSAYQCQVKEQLLREIFFLYLGWDLKTEQRSVFE